MGRMSHVEAPDPPVNIRSGGFRLRMSRVSEDGLLPNTKDLREASGISENLGRRRTDGSDGEIRNRGHHAEK